MPRLLPFGPSDIVSTFRPLRIDGPAHAARQAAGAGTGSLRETFGTEYTKSYQIKTLFVPGRQFKRRVGANRRRRAPARTTRSSEDTGSRLRLWDRACATPSAVCIVRSVLAGESRGRRGFYSSPCQQPLKSSWLLESFNWPWPLRWLLCIACKWTVSHPRFPLLERTGEEG